MKIAVVGTGYVGLVVGTCLAETGHDVSCVDVDAAKVARLQRGELPFYEPGLRELVERGVKEKRLAFTSDLKWAMRQIDVAFLAVPTPMASSGAADLSHVQRAAIDVARALVDYAVVVVKSTVPAGTAARLRRQMADVARRPFSLVSNPEFLRQGSAVDDFLRPDRVVVGLFSREDGRAEPTMTALYAPMTRTGAPIIVTDPASAELCKYAANAYLATRISFVNEIAGACDAVGADVDAVRRAMGADRRIGPSFLFPGLGYGGSCFSKDVAALDQFARDAGYDFQILPAVRRVNERQRACFVERVAERLRPLAGKTIAAWGLSFKPKTDDLRDAPSLTVIEGLLARGARVHAYDPEARDAARRLLRAVEGECFAIVDDAYQALVDADALVVLTEWNEFRQPDFARMRMLMRTPIVLDGRNVYRPEEMRQHGFAYESIGRPSVGPEETA